MNRLLHRLCVIENHTRCAICSAALPLPARGRKFCKAHTTLAIGQGSAPQASPYIAIADNSAFINDDEIVDAEILPDSWTLPQQKRA